MTAKEKLLERAKVWSDEQAEIALRAVEGPGIIDEWGDLDAQTDAAAGDVMRDLAEEEAAAGFSWEDKRRS